MKAASVLQPATFVIVSHVGTPDDAGVYAEGNLWPGVVTNN